MKAVLFLFMLDLNKYIIGIRELMRAKEFIVESGLIYRGYRCTKDCSGHKAGFSWARYWGLTDPNKCPYGKSNSFWEGCKSIIPGPEK